MVRQTRCEQVSDARANTDDGMPMNVGRKTGSKSSAPGAEGDDPGDVSGDDQRGVL